MKDDNLSFLSDKTSFGENIVVFISNKLENCLKVAHWQSSLLRKIIFTCQDLEVYWTLVVLNTSIVIIKIRSMKSGGKS